MFTLIIHIYFSAPPDDEDVKKSMSADAVVQSSENNKAGENSNRKDSHFIKFF
jgi:hypothetical protein